MQMTKFEKKAEDFLINSGIIPAITDDKSSLFLVIVNSTYKNKRLIFQINDIAFEVSAENLEELFDKAFRVLKSYGPKATRECNKGEVETTSEGEQE